MRVFFLLISICFCSLIFMLVDGTAKDDTFAGKWYAILSAPAGELPFELSFQKDGNNYSGELNDGHHRVKLQNFKLEEGRLSFGIDDSRVRFVVERRGDQMAGAWTRAGSSVSQLSFTAARTPSIVKSSRNASDFAGEWHCVRKEDGKETPITLVVRVEGSGIEGTGIDPTGDFGSMVGRIVADRLVLTRFDGQSLSFISAALEGDQLNVIATRSPGSKFSMTGVRKGARLLLPDPSSVAKVNSISFNFPDPKGDVVRFPGDRFKGKAVIINIMGTWCPNCHDETPLLIELYNKYHNRGLEIVSLAFEAHATEDEDREAIERYKRSRNIPYPILYAGKVDGGGPANGIPGLEQFAGYPTNIFINRQGRILSTHTGFWGPATGEKHLIVKREFEEAVKRIVEE
jgi:thiol-disulfide isomerase/thioredoxin